MYAGLARAVFLAAALGVIARSALGCSSSSQAASGPPRDAGDALVDAADASLDDPPVDPKYQAFADAFDAERVKLGAPGAAVAILEHGAVTFAHGFGAKGPSDPLPVRARTLFRIGSMTKALTAATFMSLVDEGKLDPKATLKSVAPGIAIPGPELAGLTLHQLLSQQSGLFDYLVVDASADDAALESFLTSSLPAHEYFMDPPGTFWDYANPNYYLVGLAIQRAAGGPVYRDVVKQRVLDRLGMSRTFFLPSEVVVDGDFTSGKSTDANGAPWDVAPAAYDNAWARPAGYAFSSVLDYARFVAFLYAGDARVLTDASRAAMQSPQVSTLALAYLQSYGYGLFVDAGFRIADDFYATPIVHHSGDIPGWASDFYLVPATGFGIVVFANADVAHFSTSVVAALESFGSLPAKTALASGVGPDPATFAALAGAYDDAHNVGRVTVAVDASQVVTIAMPDVDAANVPYDKTLQPVSLDNFVLTIQGTPQIVTFVRDAAGGYAWMRTRYFVAKRQPAATAPLHRAPLDAAALRARLHAPRL